MSLPNQNSLKDVQSVRECLEGLFGDVLGIDSRNDSIDDFLFVGFRPVVRTLHRRFAIRAFGSSCTRITFLALSTCGTGITFITLFAFCTSCAVRAVVDSDGLRAACIRDGDGRNLTGLGGGYGRGHTISTLGTILTVCAVRAILTGCARVTFFTFGSLCAGCARRTLGAVLTVNSDVVPSDSVMVKTLLPPSAVEVVVCSIDVMPTPSLPSAPEEPEPPPPIVMAIHLLSRDFCLTMA